MLEGKFRRTEIQRTETEYIAANLSYQLAQSIQLFLIINPTNVAGTGTV
jgi:hypothetical protein